MRFWWAGAALVFALQAQSSVNSRVKDEQDALGLSPDADAAYGADFRGRQITQDVADLMARFKREGWAPMTGSLVPDPRQLNREQRERATAMFDYWALYPALAVNRDVWSTFLERNH